MSILTWNYQRILRNINLTPVQLSQLKKKLIPANICYGPFLQGNTMCPTTTALEIKIGRKKLSSTRAVRSYLQKSGVKTIDLWIFYIVFDLPCMFSQRFFRYALTELQRSVDDLKRSM